MEQLKVLVSFRASLILILCYYKLNKLIRYYLAAQQHSWHARQLNYKAASTYPHLDPILGLDAFYSAMRAVPRGHELDDSSADSRELAAGSTDSK
jgi:hypothetical protein